MLFVSITMNNSNFSKKDINKALQEARMQLGAIHHERYFKVVYNFSIILLKNLTVEEIVWDVAKNVISELELEDCVIYLFDEKKEYLIQRAAHGPKNPYDFDIKNPIKIKKGDGIVGTVGATGIPELIKDTSVDNRYILDDEFRLSELAVPIMTEGEILGVIDSEHPEKNFYSENHLEILSAISSLTAIKLLQAISMEKLEIYKQELEKQVLIRTKELERVIKKLSNSNTELQNFAYTISHDFREPLRMITSYLGLIKRRYSDDLDPEGMEFLHFALDGGKRLDGMIKDLLSYSRLNNDVHSQMVDLNEILEKVIMNLSLFIEQTNCKINYDRMPVVYGKEVLLVQLFQNLVENALKFRQEQQPEIWIGCREAEDYWEFYVRDNGLGIPEDEQDKVFNIFTKGVIGKKQKGSGIGLATCKRIIDKHQGNIKLDSTLGEGTTFWFTIKKLKEEMRNGDAVSG